MEKRKILGAILILIGFVLILNSFSGMTGFAVADSIGKGVSSILGFVFVIGGFLVFIGGQQEGLKGLERTIKKVDKGELNPLEMETKRKENIENCYPAFRDFLRKGDFSKLPPKVVGMYGKYKKELESLPNSKKATYLKSRLSELSYDPILNQLVDYQKLRSKNFNRDPLRIKKAKDSSFDDEVYVRFENEKHSVAWPKVGDVDFVPFDEIRVNPARGNLFSIISLKKLVSDKFLTKKGELNSKWSPQKRQDYLSSTYGIDKGSRQRNMVFFNLEKGTSLIPFGQYSNIKVKDKIPLVKIIKKKK